MSQRILDEREHRRGLVLGLTLAEVLILLLFMLLLALGARLNQLQREAHAALSERDRLKGDLAILMSKLPTGVNAEEFAAQARLSIVLKAQVADLEEQLRVVRPVIDAAARTDPNDPPGMLKRLVDAVASLSTEQLVDLAKRGGDTKGQVKIETGGLKGHNWPPIIRLSEADGYFFATGSAELSPEFKVKLATSVIDQLQDLVERYQVDVVEVIGHTDEQRLIGRPSNLDATLIPFLSGKPALDRFVPSDNAGLGLARAASMVRFLAADERLSALSILPLSGGHLIEVGDRLSTGLSPGDVKQRRRIEIRVRRSDKAVKSWQSSVSPEPPLEPAKTF